MMTAKTRRISEGDVIQIMNEEHLWYPALLVVDEVTDYGCMASLMNKVNGIIQSEPTRLNMRDYVRVGRTRVHIDY